MVGDHFLVRGYENGQHFMIREKFSPTLFVPSKKETRYKTLQGECVEAIQPGTVRDCREFIKNNYDNDVLNAYEECRDFLSQLLVDNQVNLEI